MTTPASTSVAVYRDATRPIPERVQDLLERMTLDEKIAQLGSAWVYQLLDDGAFAPEKAQNLMAHGIGQITRIGGASSLRPADSAQLANTIQRFLIEQTRLGIPAIVHEETCSGYMARSATCFPQIIGLASTWEPELAEALTEPVPAVAPTVRVLAPVVILPATNVSASSTVALRASDTPVELLTVRFANVVMPEPPIV